MPDLPAVPPEAYEAGDGPTREAIRKLTGAIEDHMLHCGEGLAAVRSDDWWWTLWAPDRLAEVLAKVIWSLGVAEGRKQATAEVDESWSRAVELAAPDENFSAKVTFAAGVAEGRRQAAEALAESQARFDRHMWGHDWRPSGVDGTVRCRHCSFGREDDPASHRMDCRLYAGPLRHEWIRTRYNPTFGGVDYYCICGGSVRVHDEQTTSEPTCPKVSEVWRAARIAEENTDG